MRIAAVWATVALAANSSAFGQVGPTHPERLPVIESTYEEMLGRAPDEYEVFWWTLYPDQPPGVINADRLRRALLRRLANSDQECADTARRVRAATGASIPEPQLLELVEAVGFERAVRAVRGAP